MITKQQFDQFIGEFKYPPNRFQQKALEEVAFGLGNIEIDAKAGSGKTTLLKMVASLLVKMGVSPYKVLFQAFNKSIEIELNEQLPDDFKAKTSHALGFAMCKAYYKTMTGKNIYRPKFNKYKDIAYELAEKLYPSKDEKGERYKARNKIQALTDKVLANAIEPTDEEAIIAIAEHYGIDGLTANIIKSVADAAAMGIKRFQDTGEIDFIDMIWLPYALNMQPERQYDWLLVDECQDLNVLQQSISQKHLKPDGRIILVGDPRQAIYGFAGADAESFKNLQIMFDAKMLELNICYRCPTSHINLAKTLVPSIEPAPSAEAGTLEYKHMTNLAKTMTAGSMVICRLNAPLISAYFEFIKIEKPAIIMGRDVASNLTKIIDEVAKRQGFIYRDIGKHLAQYFKQERAFLETKPNSENQIAQLSDSIDCLQVCVANFDARDVTTLKEKLEALFVDETDKNFDPKQVVMLCTVHKSKGLEADHIGLLFQRAKPKNGSLEWENIMPLSWENQREWEAEQERNIMYVAYTRAKKTLSIFGGYDEENPPQAPSPITVTVTDDDALVIETIGEPDAKPITITSDMMASIQDDEPEEEIAEVPLSEAQKWAREMVELAENAVILDFETTNGYKGKNDTTTKVEPIQLAIINMKGEVCLNQIYLPDGDIAEGAFEAHGISREYLEENKAIRWSDQIDLINRLLEGKHVIAYNAFNFDSRVYNDTAKHYDTALANIEQWHCAMMQYISHNQSKLSPWGQPGGWWKLGEALEQESIAFNEDNAHDGLYDVKMTYALIRKLAGEDIQSVDELQFGHLFLPAETDSPTDEYHFGQVVEIKSTGQIASVLKADEHGDVEVSGYDVPAQVHSKQNIRVITANNSPTDESPSIENDAPTEEEIAEEPITPKKSDPYTRIEAIFRSRLTIEEAYNLRDLLNEIIPELEAEKD